jgi:hypothetical protein
MISKAALFVASLAAAFTLAFALALAGFAPGSSQAAPASTATSAQSDPAAADVVAPDQVQVDTVYVAPPAEQQTITVHKVAASSGEGESENEGDD